MYFMEHLLLLKFSNIHKCKKLSKYKIIYNKNTYFSGLNFKNKKNGHFFNLLELNYIYIDLKILRNFKNLQIIMNKVIVINNISSML